MLRTPSIIVAPKTATPGKFFLIHGIIVAASREFFADFEAALLTAGFGDWPMPEWPG